MSEGLDHWAISWPAVLLLAMVVQCFGSVEICVGIDTYCSVSSVDHVADQLTDAAKDECEAGFWIKVVLRRGLAAWDAEPPRPSLIPLIGCPTPPFATWLQGRQSRGVSSNIRLRVQAPSLPIQHEPAARKRLAPAAPAFSLHYICAH
jgi:hypothetical protein